MQCFYPLVYSCGVSWSQCRNASYNIYMECPSDVPHHSASVCLTTLFPFRFNSHTHLRIRLPKQLPWQTRPSLRHPRLSEVLIQIQDNLQRIPTSQIRQRRTRLVKSQSRCLRSPSPSRSIIATRQRQQALEEFIPSQCETELRTTAHDTCRTTLEEGAEALLLPDSLGAVAEGCVGLLALAGFDL